MSTRAPHRRVARRDQRFAEALRVYEGLRGLLRDELGAAPSPTVQQMHHRLLTHESVR
jgi:DNA-binding SARP family transcriptional activator